MSFSSKSMTSRNPQKQALGFGKAIQDEMQQTESLSKSKKHLDENSTALSLTSKSENNRISKANELAREGRLEAASVLCRQLVNAKSVQPDPYALLGAIYLKSNRVEDSLSLLLRAKELGAEGPAIDVNLGIAYRKLFRYEDAKQAFCDGIAKNPGNPKILINLAHILGELGEYNKAIIFYREILTMTPDNAEAHWGLSLALLAMKRFREGWDEYNWRWSSKHFAFDYLRTNHPQWTPEVKCNCLLLWGEQGIGDQIMFASMLPSVHNLAAQVIVQLDGRLVNLLQRSFSSLSIVDNTSRMSEEHYDHHLPLGSLGRFMRCSEQEFLDGKKKYLCVDFERSLELRSLLAQDSKILCGISWTSTAENGEEKSLTLVQLAEALSSPDVQLVNLQYGEVDDEIALLRNQTGIKIAQVPEINCQMDQDGLAALIGACDLVVTISNATAHLSGSVGKQTLLMLPKVADWRWFDQDKQSLWYENVEIYRQTINHCWEDVLAAVSERLRSLVPGLIRN
jgi:hypothetical protein